MTPLAAIPSPTVNQIQIFGLSIRAYAVCILIGIVVAIWLSNRRWIARGGASGEMLDLAVWAVPFGIVGGRIYHVISSPAAYFGEGGDPIRAFYIWEGGLGIWGAIAFGALGAWIAARRAGLRVPVIADAVAPGIVFAQAIGRLGNWFNNELYGGPDDSFLGLKIWRMDPVTGKATDYLGTFQPTFLYELVWCTIVGFVLLWADRRFRIGGGRLFALYVALYCLGRFFIEQLRTDPAEMILGQRINVWTSIIVGLAAVAYAIVRRTERETSPYVDDRRTRQDDDGTNDPGTPAGEPLAPADAPDAPDAPDSADGENPGRERDGD